MDRFIESQRLKPSKTDLVELALREFLEREGHYGDTPAAVSQTPAPATKPIPLIPISPEPFSLPLPGKVAAGTPIAVLEQSHDEFEFHSHFGDDGIYMLHVTGSSMTQEGILDGDYAIVRRRPTPKNTEIVVARVNDEYTLKRLVIKRQHDEYWLSPRDGKTPPFRLQTERGDVVIGVLVGVLRLVKPKG